MAACGHGIAPLLGLSITFAALDSVLDSFGWNLKDHVNQIEPTAYVLLLVYWVYAAWRPPRPLLKVRVVSS